MHTLSTKQKCLVKVNYHLTKGHFFPILRYFRGRKINFSTTQQHGYAKNDAPFIALLRNCAKRTDLCQGIQDDQVIVIRLYNFQESSDGLHLRGMHTLSTKQKCLVKVNYHLTKGHFFPILRYFRGRKITFSTTQQHGYAKNDAPFIALLRNCAKRTDLCQGIQVHADILKHGLFKDSSCAVVSMYAKCGLPEKAHYLLQEISYVDVYTWTALISSFVNQGQAYHALYCYGRLQNQGLYADAVTFSAILKACASIQDLEIGQQIHDQISKRDLLSNNVFLGTALIHMYVSCGALERAVQVLRELSVRDAIVWNTLLAGYVQHGDGHKALRGFEQMQQEGLYPNAGTFLCVMKACGIVGAIEKGKQLHHEIIRQGLLTSNPLLGKALVTMYAKCGLISKAQSVLEALPFQDKNLWSMLIIKYVEQGQGEEALKCFECMERKGIHMDAVAFICALKACGCVGAIEKGRELHMKISEQGLLKDNALLGTALLGMYIKCGDMDKARQVLDELFVRDVVVWSALIAGYAQVAQGDKALDCFDQMQYEGVSGNAVTFMAVLKACGVLGAIQKGEQIHDKIMELGLLQQSLALGNALADMYIKCGQVRKARQVLEDLPLRDEISWNILIAGYIEQGQDHKALNCLKQMEIEGLAPDPATFTCVLKACGSLGAVEQGKQIHDEIIRQGLLEKDVVLGTSLMDMYVKCGLFDRAQEVIEHLQGRDIISWSSLLAGYADSGDGENALNCFNEMQCRGLIPDAAAFSCMLNACAYSGLVKEAQALFTIMKTKFDIDPELRHYVSLIDLFGHFGHLDKATEVIQKLPDAELAAAWASLLALCQVWGNLNIGRWAFEHSIQKKE